MTRPAAGAREPWVAVKVGMPDNHKVIELPNDTARYGLIVMWARLKRQRPSGMFRSQSVAKELLGRFGRYVDDWVRGGFLHVAPFTCDDRRCQAAFAAAPAGALVAHSWHLYQREHAARQLDYRDSRGGSDGQSDTTSDAVSDGLGDSVGDSYSRALSPVSVNSHVSKTTSPVAQGGADDPLYRALDWLSAHRLGLDPARSIGIELAKLVDRVGADRIIGAMEEVLAAAEREGVELIDGRQVVTRVQQFVAPLYGAPRKPPTPAERERAEGLAQLDEARRRRGAAVP